MRLQLQNFIKIKSDPKSVRNKRNDLMVELCNFVVLQNSSQLMLNSISPRCYRFTFFMHNFKQIISRSH